MVECYKCGRKMNFVCENVLGSKFYECPNCGHECIDWSNLYPTKGQTTIL